MRKSAFAMGSAAALFAVCGVASAQEMLQPANPAKRVYAKRFAMGKLLPDGTFRYTTPWMNIVRNQGTETTWQSAFDCYEGDANNIQYPPIGFLDCGNNGTLFPGAAPSSRWWFGPAYYSPQALNDMTVGQGFAGRSAGRISGAWSHSTTLQRAILLISTFETFGECVLPAGSGPLGDSVLLDFGNQTGGQGYFFFDEELVGGNPPVPFDIDLPVDGSGGYQQAILNAPPIQGQPLSFATGAGVQNMYWGTDDDVPNPSGRIGTQAANNWADDTAPIGTYELPGDCFAPVPPAGGCPSQLGTMIQFWAKEGGGTCPDCACNFDTTTGPDACDVFDFLVFSNLYDTGDPCACDQDLSTGPGMCDIFDFLIFSNNYDIHSTQGCP